jgi:hypothetical protein
MQDQVSRAIRERRLLRFDYEGHSRVVEPHQLGLDSAGHVALSAFWVSGYSESGELPRWRLYLIDEMSNPCVLDELFDGPRPGYKRTPNGSILSAICEL